MNRETCYLNTDLDLMSRTPIAHLCEEFEQTCCVLHQTFGDDGVWRATIETERVNNASAEEDIRSLLAVPSTLSSIARQQWESCHFRDFNIGFDCGDTWGYPHILSADCIRAVAEAGCSVSVTLYPIRDDDEEQTKSTFVG